MHHQQNQGSSLAVSNVGRTNGTAQLRGLAYNGESPPPDYNIVVHDTRHGFLLFFYFSIDYIFERIIFLLRGHRLIHLT